MEEERKEEIVTKNPAGMPREELEKLQEEEPVSKTETSTEEKKAATEKATEKVTEKATEKATTKEGESKDDTARIKAENEKLLSAVKNQDKLLAKLGTELGLLRKKTPEDERAELETIRDAWTLDPIEGDKLLQEYKEKKKTEENADRQYQLLRAAKETQELVSKDIPAFEESLADIAELIKADGANEETVNAFRQSPYVFGREVLLNLARRNEALKELKNTKAALEKLKEENEQLKQRPGAMLKKIEEATRTSTLSAKSGGAGIGGGDGRVKSVAGMSREELQKQDRGG